MARAARKLRWHLRHTVRMIAAMAYMLLIVEDPAQRATRSLAEGEAVFGRMVQWGEDLRRQGLLRAMESLSSQDGAARVQVSGGRAKVLDGPFAEAKEMVGGFFVVECGTREEAVALAARCPAAEWATVEVRALGPCYT